MFCHFYFVLMSESSKILGECMLPVSQKLGLEPALDALFGMLPLLPPCDNVGLSKLAMFE